MAKSGESDDEMVTPAHLAKVVELLEESQRAQHALMAATLFNRRLLIALIWRMQDLDWFDRSDIESLLGRVREMTAEDADAPPEVLEALMAYVNAQAPKLFLDLPPKPRPV